MLANTNLNTDLLWHIFFATSFVMFCAWLWQCKSKNSGIVDAIWALGIAAASLYIALFSSGDIELRIILGLIGVIWYTRVGIHLLIRLLSEKQDGRYNAIREYFGNKTDLFHIFFYQLQAGFVVMCILPIWLLAHYQNVSLWQMLAAILVVALAFIGQHQADHQLHLWRQDPDNKGKTCRLGLWKYSRHPNYFFEWCHWCIYPILGLGSTVGIYLWLAPAIMFCFLYWGTGIPYTEKQAIKSRGDDYRNYQKTTSAFFPWPPKPSS